MSRQIATFCGFFLRTNRPFLLGALGSVLLLWAALMTVSGSQGLIPLTGVLFIAVIIVASLLGRKLSARDPQAFFTTLPFDRGVTLVAGQATIFIFAAAAFFLLSLADSNLWTMDRLAVPYLWMLPALVFHCWRCLRTQYASILATFCVVVGFFAFNSWILDSRGFNDYAILHGFSGFWKDMTALAVTVAFVCLLEKRVATAAVATVLGGLALIGLRILSMMGMLCQGLAIDCGLKHLASDEAGIDRNLRRFSMKASRLFGVGDTREKLLLAIQSVNAPERLHQLHVLR